MLKRKTRNKPKSLNSSRTSFSLSTSDQPPPVVVSSPSKPIWQRSSSHRLRVPRSERRWRCRGGSRSIGVSSGGEAFRGERSWRWISRVIRYAGGWPWCVWRGMCAWAGALVGWMGYEKCRLYLDTDRQLVLVHLYLTFSRRESHSCCINHSRCSGLYEYLRVSCGESKKHTRCRGARLWRRSTRLRGCIIVPPRSKLTRILLGSVTATYTLLHPANLQDLSYT